MRSMYRGFIVADKNEWLKFREKPLRQGDRNKNKLKRRTIIWTSSETNYFCKAPFTLEYPYEKIRQSLPITEILDRIPHEPFDFKLNHLILLLKE